ncbi:TIGR03915 family putative DNA repair protein [Enterococcus rivorum]|uniref:DUF4130 domain-containing protein n=1 Tax=Enterococcus rivorum TaxID=762845 RepID=A0A1E5KZK5_9ENTE|nr:TIGR03915 family putative DNA repair protein [Enterococcus rivorum]MBP2099327.1 putative DNA metabolism protein [Enterococcus rivorum]OEH83291.1 hypothetical protein BCR26_10190 [Enterococcus rivorum]
MSIRKISATWEYDGSFIGFLMIVYYAFKEKNVPETILTPETAIQSLFPSRWIETDVALANKINKRLKACLRKENLQFIVDGFYCSLKNKEVFLLDAIEIALNTNDLVENYLGHPSILALQKSLKSLFSEVHLYTGFVRFEYVGEFLYSKIQPKHFSLPYLCPHFAERYPLETIMIYDETHQLLGIIEQGQISFIENIEEPNFETLGLEKEIQTNWQTFLQAVTIDERRNERCQMSHLPKRFRKNMVDFQQF